MSTSDPTAALGTGLPTGLPDVASLTQLANQLFLALPAAGQGGLGGPAAQPAAAAPAAVPSLPHSPGSLKPHAAGLPSSGPTLPGVAVLGAAIPSTPAIPGISKPGGLAGPSLPFASAPSFYFLEGAGPANRGPALPASVPATGGFDAEAVRRDFPILRDRVNGRPLIWLDNAATTQKPQAVIDRLSRFYLTENSNIHRGAHELAARATDAYEEARDKVRGFLNAGSVDEIVFVQGATEAINLVAQTWGRQNVGPGDEIVITWLEHHANIVPWQMLCAETGAKLKVVPVDDHGQVLLDEYGKLLGPRTKLVAFTQVSNALGTVTPAQKMVEMAHRAGAVVLVDGAQSVSHMRTDVQELDCDFFVFSGHKVFGPTGIGVLYGKAAVLEAMPPWQGGGNMIQDVTFEKTLYHPPPGLFEAGTGNIADAVGLGAAIDYLQGIGLELVARHEHDLLEHATRLLKDVPGLRLIGTAPEKPAGISFTLDGFKSEEVGGALNREGIAVRSGHHCAQPILRRFGVETTVRPSFALYNTYADVDTLAAALHRLKSGNRRFA